jgi:hypothetical protein
MRNFNKKPNNNLSIGGIMGVLLLILGVGSLTFQYSTTTVNVYAQVARGPLWNMGEGDTADKAVSQHADTDGTNLYLAYQDEETGNVKLGKVVPNAAGELGEAEEDDPQTIINGATHPAMDATPGGRVYVAAEQQGEIAVVGCTDDDDDCEPSQIVSTPGETEPPVGIEGEGGTGSCTDKVDNDGDGKVDLADIDCKWSSEQVSSERGLCSDNNDNDGDHKTDSKDPDCFHPSTNPSTTAGTLSTPETTGAEEDTAETTGAEDNDTEGVEPTSFNLQPGATSSPQLTFVSTDGGDAPPASDTDIASSSSDDGRHVYVVYERDGEIMLVASNNSGGTWGPEINVSNTPGAASINASVATSADGRIVDVAWVDAAGSGDIFYARLTNFGTTLEYQKNLSNNRGASEDYQLLREGPNVYLVWRDKTTASGGETYFIRSTNDGAQGSFGDIINLSSGTGQTFQAARDPDMDAQGSKVVVTWAAYPDRNAVRPGEILVRESLNSGNPGTFDQRINAAQTSQTDSKEPQVAYIDESGSEIYVAFLDTGGPTRVFTAAGTYNVLATERDSGGRSFSALTNLADREATPPTGNLSPRESNSLLELTRDVASWDPSGGRG